jgi:hypothetical protein
MYEIKIRDIGLALNVTPFNSLVKLDKLLILRKKSRPVTYSGHHTVHVSFSLARKASKLFEFSLDTFPTKLGQVSTERCRKGLKLG